MKAPCFVSFFSLLAFRDRICQMTQSCGAESVQGLSQYSVGQNYHCTKYAAKAEMTTTCSCCGQVCPDGQRCIKSSPTGKFECKGITITWPTCLSIIIRLVGRVSLHFTPWNEMKNIELFDSNFLVLWFWNRSNDNLFITRVRRENLWRHTRLVDEKFFHIQWSLWIQLYRSVKSDEEDLCESPIILWDVSRWSARESAC